MTETKLPLRIEFKIRRFFYFVDGGRQRQLIFINKLQYLISVCQMGPTAKVHSTFDSVTPKSIKERLEIVHRDRRTLVIWRTEAAIVT